MPESQRINVFLDANIKQFVKGFKRAHESIRGFGNRIKSQSPVIRRVFNRWGKATDFVKMKFRSMVRTFRNDLPQIRASLSAASNFIRGIMGAIRGYLEPLGITFDIQGAIEYNRILNIIRTITSATKEELTEYEDAIKRAAEATNASRLGLAEAFIKYYEQQGKIPGYKELFNIGFRATAWLGEPEDVVKYIRTARLAAGPVGFEVDENRLASIMHNVFKGSPLFNPSEVAGRRDIVEIAQRFNPRDMIQFAKALSFIKLSTRGAPDIGAALNNFEGITRRVLGWDPRKYNVDDLIKKFVDAIKVVQAGKGRVLDFKGRDITRLLTPEYLKSIQGIVAFIESAGIKAEDISGLIEKEAQVAVKTGLEFDQKAFQENSQELQAQVREAQNKVIQFTTKMIPGIIEVLNRLNETFTADRIETLTNAIMRLTDKLPDLISMLADLVEFLVPEQTGEPQPYERTGTLGTIKDISEAGNYVIERGADVLEKLHVPIAPGFIRGITNASRKLRDTLLEFVDVSYLWFEASPLIEKLKKLGLIEGESRDDILEELNEIMKYSITEEDMEKFKKRRPGVSFDEVVGNPQYLGDLLDIYMKRYIKERFLNMKSKESLGEKEERTTEKKEERTSQEKKEEKENLKKIASLLNRSAIEERQNKLVFNLNVDPNTGQMDITQPVGTSSIRSTFTRATGNLRV